MAIATIVNGLLISVLSVGVRAAPQGYYASKYDHLDVNTILNNRRMVTYYAACLLNKGPCPPQGLELKRILPEAMQTNCARCTEKQKTVAYRGIKRLKKEYPKIWEELSNQWDPSGTYIAKFEASFDSQTSLPTTPLVPLGLSNTFDDTAESNDHGVIQKIPQPSSQTSVPVSTPRTTSSTAAPKTTPNTPKITHSTTTKAFTNTPATASVTKPGKTGVSIGSITPVRIGPLENVGAGIRATVSFGTNVVEGIVKGLNEVGTRVVQTGAKLAGSVISAVIPVRVQVQ